MRQRSRQLSHGRDSRNMGKLLTIALELGFRVFALCDIDNPATHPKRVAVPIQFHSPKCRNPPNRAVIESDPIFGEIIAAAFQRAAHCFARRLAIFGMQRVDELLQINWIRSWPPEKGAALRQEPDFVTCNVPGPQTESGGVGRQIHPFLALSELRFAPSAACVL